MIRAVYPGTFDPIHNGHIDVATRAAGLFDEVIFAVYDCSPKLLTFDTATRAELARAALAHLPNVSVTTYSSLTVDFARQHGAKALVRGLRAISDFEFELQMALTNKKLAPDVEVVCLMTSLEYAYLSSSILKEVAMLHGDVTSLAPALVRQALSVRFGQALPGEPAIPIHTSRD